MKLLLACFLVLAATLLEPESAGAVCYDGCSSISLNVGTFIKITANNSGTCGACGAGTTTEHTFVITDGCSDFTTATNGKFCSTSSIPVGTKLEVNSIGAGCSGTPQGCVRVCTCQ